MDNSNVNQPSGKSCGFGAGLTGFLLLIIGILVGVFGTRFFWHRSTSVAMNNERTTTVPVAWSAQPAANGAAATQSYQWDPIRQMNDMQTAIDQVIQQSFAQYNPKISTAAPATTPGYALTMDVRDLKDRYQVDAYLPDTDTKAQDVKVNLKGRNLKVDVANKTSEKQTVKNTETTVNAWGNYEEVVRLDGPLKDNQMKVQRKEHELVISIPKA